MDMHPKKRLEILIEAPILNRVTAFLETKGAAGYTVLPALSGYGPDGRWSREGQVGDAGRMVVIMCIVSADLKDALLDELFALVSRQIGHVVVSDCEVIRADRF